MPARKKSPRTYVISAIVDPAIIMEIAEHMTLRGLVHQGSYSFIINTIMDDYCIINRLQPKKYTMDAVLTKMVELGFSIRQAGATRWGRIALNVVGKEVTPVEEARSAADGTLPPALAAKMVTGEEWSPEDITILQRLGVITYDEAQEWRKEHGF